MYFIFIFISPSVPRFSVKKSVNQLIKNKRPKEKIKIIMICTDVNKNYMLATCPNQVGQSKLYSTSRNK